MSRFYSDVEGRHVTDVMPGKILTADVSSLISVGGGGKGMLSGDVMARISRGWPMPPYEADSPLVDENDCATAGYCIHIPLEDDPERTCWWRLQAAGADMTRIALLDKVTRTKASTATRPQFSLPDDIGVLRSEIEAIGDVRLVTIDPFMSAATTTVAFNQQLRNRLLVPLMELARDTGVAIWLIHHTTKGTNNGRLAPNSTKSITDYVAGSKGFTDTLRMNTLIADSDVDDRLKVWKGVKSNGGDGEELMFAIVASGPGDNDAHVEWKQPVMDGSDPRIQQALQRRILDQLIAAGQPMTSQAMVKLVQQSYVLVDKAMRQMEKTGQLAKRRGAYQPLAIDPPRPAKPLPAAPVAAATPADDWWWQTWQQP